MILASLLGQSFVSWWPDRRPHTFVQIFHVLELPGYGFYCRSRGSEKMVSPGFHFLFVCPHSAQEGAGCRAQFGGGGGGVELMCICECFAVNAFFLCHPL